MRLTNKKHTLQQTMTTSPKKRGRPAKVKEPVVESTVEPVTSDTDAVEYTLTVKMGNETYTGKGATILEALTTLPAPPKITTKCVIQLVHGEHRTKELLKMPYEMKRLLYPQSLIFTAKKLNFLLK
jgi:hypothetical protein